MRFLSTRTMVIEVNTIAKANEVAMYQNMTNKVDKHKNTGD